MSKLFRPSYLGRSFNRVDLRKGRLVFLQFFCFVCGLILAALLFSIVLSQLYPETAMAQQSSELQTITVEGTSKAESASQATQEIQAKAIEDTARAQVLELIGEKRYAKSKAQVEVKIVKQAAKFMPFVQPGAPVQLPDHSWKMSIDIRVSQASLRKMVLDAGLLSDSDGSASIVPLIAFVDRTRNLSSRWWMGLEKDDAHRFLLQLSKEFYDRLQADFSRAGFHMVRPMGMQASILPEAMRTEHITMPEMKAIADYLQSPLVLRGDVRIREAKDVASGYAISIRIQVVQTTASRTIAEISRSIETEAGPMESVVQSKMKTEMPELCKDLATQVLDAWQRGTINANLIQIAVRGNLTPKQLSDFKAGVLRTVHDVKSLRERMFEQGQVTFEVDFAGQIAQLSEKMKALQLPGFTSQVVENTDQGLVLQVHPK